jgi:hypothetical protein
MIEHHQDNMPISNVSCRFYATIEIVSFTIQRVKTVLRIVYRN